MVPQENGGWFWQSLRSSGTFTLLDGIHPMETIRLKSILVHFGISDSYSQMQLIHTFSHPASLETRKNIKLKDNDPSKSHLIVRHLCKLGIE